MSFLTEASPLAPRSSPGDLLCFSQLRWDFVYQRPNHLMARAARNRRVWYVEEPVFEGSVPRLLVEERAPGLAMVRPLIPPGWPEHEVDTAVAGLLRDLLERQEIVEPVLWYYTPMALPWSDWIPPAAVVYDCMDELSAFRGAPPRLHSLESALLQRADVVFTGGRALYEAKRRRHSSVHAFPSAVDSVHFGKAREPLPEVHEQVGLPHPRIGWFGVIDERTDLDLLADIADLRPHWSYILVGPTVKIDPASVPQRPNLHYLGPRPYPDLPSFIAGWDVTMMPFLRNESTRYISPTKTLEYLAAGRPVVSTSIADVVEPYERLGLVRVADSAPAFVAAIEAALGEDRAARIRVADEFLLPRSWDRTWSQMEALLHAALETRAGTGADGEAARSVAASADRASSSRV